MKTAVKSNEITAIPKLPDTITIENCIVTIDAMGCQKEIVKSIHNKKADYVIAAKANQGNLLEAIKDTALLEKPVETSIDESYGHGRIEKRTCYLYTNLSHFKHANSWKDLKNFVRIEKESYDKATKKTSKETRYDISNRVEGAKKMNHIIRTHWSVENKLHWVLDVVFNEDYARKRAGASAENFNLILKNALNTVVFESCLKEFSQYKPDEYKIVVIDNAGFHSTLNIEVPENIFLLRIPPYAPELNPCEQVWQYIKNRYKNKQFKTMKELTDWLHNMVNEMSKETIKSITGNHHYLNTFYAAL